MTTPLRLKSAQTDDIEEIEIDDNGAAMKQEIFDSFHGALDGVDVHKALVLVKIFERDRMAKGSKILTPEATRKEDVYQGRVGLVLRVGPLAFTNSKDVDFGGKKAEVGDWVWFSPANSTRLKINGVECRQIEDVNIDGKVEDPYVLL